jgi:phytoene dehydrogenase-like protein
MSRNARDDTRSRQAQLDGADGANAVVVGGGLAGLTAACYLARAGQRVTLLERAPDLGGRAATQYVDGYTFNRGAHALYTGGAASHVLRELGVRYRAAIPRDIFGRYGDRIDRMPTSAAGLFGSRLLTWSDRLDLMRLFARLSRVEAHSLGRTTIQEWLDVNARRPRVRLVMDAFARTFVYSAALDLVSADVFVDKLQRSMNHPVQYVEGGWQSLVEGLRGVAEAAGARILTGQPVEAVLHEGGHVVGVRTRRGETIAAEAVIVATPPREAGSLVGGEDDPRLRRTVEELVPAHMACLDVALRRLPEPGQPVILDLDGPLFLTAQSRYVRVAPAGAGLIHTFKVLDPRQATDPRQDEQELEELLDAAQPGWRQELVRRFWLPRMAAVGALPLARTGGFGGRPAPDAPGLQGLYLAGDWVGSEGFLADASMASARSAASLVVAREHRAQERPVPTASKLAISGPRSHASLGSRRH